MAAIFKSLYILPLFFFISCYADDDDQSLLGPNAFQLLNDKKLLGPHELFGNPFGNPNDYNKNVANDVILGNLKSWNPIDWLFPSDPASDNFSDPPSPPSAPDAGDNNNNEGDNDNFKSGKNELQTKNKGKWKVVSKNSGVSAMHVILLPNVNKVLMFDSTIWRISNVKLLDGICRLLNSTTGENDCYAHSVLFDIETFELTTLQLNTDTWCSSGGLTVDGNLVSTGGFQGGANTVRYLETCDGCGWREFPTALAAKRWYSTQVALPNGDFVVIGGRESFSYEYIPPEGASNEKPIFFKFLVETNDKDENNLYPFAHLSTDGNIFIFANNRSLLLDPKTNKIVREFPVLEGGHRNYPATGVSALLPIKLHSQNNDVIPAEILVCGGSPHIDSYTKASKDIFYTALQDCGRIRITDKKPVWKRELMPSPRVMGDLMLLPTGDVLILSGAKRGASGWGFAREPNFTPVLYKPKEKRGNRFTELAASTIPRVYHSTAAVLPNGEVLVSGSNSNNGYIYNAMFPTELRVEYFSPPYLDSKLKKYRPEIVVDILNIKFTYGQIIKLQIKLYVENVEEGEIKVTMNSSPFTTHAVSMNQRLVILGLDRVESNVIQGYHNIIAYAPPHGAITPPGYYMLSVVYRGVPSVAVWAQIK